MSPAVCTRGNTHKPSALLEVMPYSSVCLTLLSLWKRSSLYGLIRLRGPIRSKISKLRNVYTWKQNTLLHFGGCARRVRPPKHPGVIPQSKGKKRKLKYLMLSYKYLILAGVTGGKIIYPVTSALVISRHRHGHAECSWPGTAEPSEGRPQSKGGDRRAPRELAKVVAGHR